MTGVWVNEAQPRESTNPDEINAFLCDRVRARGEERFGAHPLPAVSLQLAQLEFRLRRFSELQAERAKAGWRIEHAEWAPADDGAVTRLVDDTPIRIRGRIDRIDTHPDGRWAIWDYKTGERVRGPERSHRDRNGEWLDLQLPLYRLLSAELGRESVPELGVIAITRDPAGCGFLSATGWSVEVLDEALGVADDVVRAIRKGDLWRMGKWKPFGDTFKALCGVGLVGVPMGEDEDGDGGLS